MVDAVPLTAVGKIDRKVLRSRAADTGPTADTDPAG